MGSDDSLRRRAEREAEAGLWPIRRALAVAALGSVAGLAVLTIVALAVLGFPPLAVAKRLAVGDLLDVLKLVLASVAGLGALFALVMNYRKQRLTEVADRREHQRVFNERFATAADQLGHAGPAIRLAGAYAMAGLADDWPDGRQTCVDVLCAYLRMPYEPDPGKDAPAAERLAFRRDQEVRHTVITIITAHLRAGSRVSWQGCDLNFTGVHFDGGSFREAVFSGDAVDFGKAEFSGNPVEFIDAKFRGASVSFRDAVFSGGGVNFARAEFSGENVDFSGATFTGAVISFAGAEFSGRRVSFEKSRFTDGWVHFGPAVFSGGLVKFDNAAFSGGHVTVSDAVFSGSQVSFFNAEFTEGLVSFGAEFSGGSVDFSRAKFSGGQLDLMGAILSGGRVYLSDPGSWSTPPLLGDIDLTDPPKGLVLRPRRL